MKMHKEYICPCCGNLNKIRAPKAFISQTQCRNCGKLVDVTFEYGPARAVYLGLRDARIEAITGTLRDTFDLEYTLVDENHSERMAFVRGLPMLQGGEHNAKYERMLDRMVDLLLDNPDCVGIELNNYWMKENE